MLDGLNFDEHQKNALITEANYAFRLNMYVFDELQSTDPYPVVTALWRILKNTIRGSK